MPGKKGNTNALKHGLYSKAFVTRNSLTIEQRRAILDACISRAFQAFQDIGDDIPKLSMLLNSIGIAVSAANTCERTLALINGNYSPLEEVLQELKAYDPHED
jgi:hypothetical protein